MPFCINCHNIRPVRYAALSIAIVPCGNHSTVRLQPYSVGVPSTYCYNIRPAGYIALAVIIITCSNNCAI